MPQDAQRHWTDPGVEKIAEGVHRIALPLPMKGLPAVNVYVVEGMTGPVVIDAGWHAEDCRAALESGLAELGYALSDIECFLITHMHWDHYTLAVALQRELGCTIMVGADDADSIAEFDQDRGLYPRLLPKLRAAGAHDVAREIEQRPLESYERDIAYGPADRWLRDGDTIEVKDGRITCIATPGHTRGHMVFAYDARGLMFTGDHVLPNASPAVGLDNAPCLTPLANYLDSLELLLQQPDGTMMPAHGPAGGSVHVRVQELLDHHRDRFAEIMKVLGNQTLNAMDIAQALPWTKHNFAYSTIEDPVMKMNAVLEVELHMDVLASRGEIVTTLIGQERRHTRVEVYP